MDYLDLSGLMHLLEKLKETFVTRAEWQAGAAAAPAAAKQTPEEGGGL